MPRRKKPTRNPWTPADLKTLRKLAGREPAPRIARELKRTESAVRQKASSLGLGLRLR
jgi:hypothetical protein